MKTYRNKLILIPVIRSEKKREMDEKFTREIRPIWVNVMQIIVQTATIASVWQVVVDPAELQRL